MTFKNYSLIILLLAGIISFLPNHTNAQTVLPEKSEVISTLKKVNDYWQSTHPDHGDREWANAVYYTGNIDFYKLYPKESYLEYAFAWAEKHNWRLSGGNTTVNADQQCAGQSYIDLFLLEGAGDEDKIAMIDSSMTRMVNQDIHDSWWWIDALYMAMPGFSRLGVYHNDTSYFEQMYRLYTNTKVSRNLYNTEEGLWYRDESFLPSAKVTPNGEDIYWSRGNGWVFGAHVRVLQQIPEDEPHRDEYIQTFREMAEALVMRQREDGLWNPSLDDPDDFGGPETSGTCFFTYGMAWGINNGFLDSATYYPVVKKAWDGLTTVSLHEDGYLGYIQGVGSQPSSSQPVTYNSNADFGVGAFLLAGTEIVKLAQGEMPVPSNFYMESAEVLDETHITVSFSKAVDPSSATQTENYTINGDVTIENVTISDNDSSVVLEVSQLMPGKYTLNVESVFSAGSEEIETGSYITVTYYGPVEISDYSAYEPGSDNVPYNTLDFDFNTRWSSEGYGEWVVYDLGEQKIVESVDIAYYNGNIRNAYFAIELSSDGVNFYQVFSGESNGETPFNEFENFDFVDEEARYVRYVGYGNSSSGWNSLTEVRINYSDITTSVIRNEKMDDMHIYPNPAEKFFTIRAEFDAGAPYSVKITDLSGKLVYNNTVNCTVEDKLYVETLDLSPGHYQVMIGQHTQQLIIK